jgi:flagellum-specific peptidoglycan hydrolase FlgJ
MHSAGKPLWQQVTAVVSLSAGGAITGFSFVPKAAAELKSPASMPIRLLALEQSARPAAAGDAMLRSAIVNVSNYYLRMAASKTSAEMEAIIWQHDSVNGVDHGQSCAAFASLTLELAAQVVGQQSWVTGGTSYPWPLQKWADVRVNPNPGSLGVVSVLQDAQAHHRWHPLGDGYQPLPGDWVLFDGHIEVVTNYASGVLSTIGGDSLPNFTVNAHQFPDPLGAQGVIGFVNNGELAGTANQATHSRGQVSGVQQAADQASQGQTAIPGAAAVGTATPTAQPAPRLHRARRSGHSAGPGRPAPSPSIPATPPPSPSIPGMPAPSPGPSETVTTVVAGAGLAGRAAARQAVTLGATDIPGLPTAAHRPAAGPTSRSANRYSRHQPSPPAVSVPDTTAQQAFISQIAPGAITSQRRYGIPASVTIAQAIDESGWGQSQLATRDHNLFGIKGTGPAGTDPLPTQEYSLGQSVTSTALFRVYRNTAESINDHGKHLATSEYYKHTMALRKDPNAFAAALTGVYATDPQYGMKLIGLMRRYNLYRFDAAAPAPARAATGSQAVIPGLAQAVPAPQPSTTQPATAQPASPPPTSAQPPPIAPQPTAPQPGTAQSAAPQASSPPLAAARSAAPSASTQSDADQPSSTAMPSTQTVSARRVPTPMKNQARKTAPRNARPSRAQYKEHIPPSVRNAFVTKARVPLLRAEPLYRDVASHSGIRWELLAACDWMQCEARPRYSPVLGEKLGTVNPDGTIYRTKSAALEQCADDLVELAWAVYQIDISARGILSVRDLANAFAAFRWGGLLKLHRTSAMEFPYSVAGLTVQHINMRWPNIDEPNTPDKPGGRFRGPFGAVPIVLGLNYPATV